MRQFLLASFFILAGLAARAVPLTFRVNMTGQTVAAAGVHVAGNFQAAAGFPGDWNPATTLLTDPDNDNIYEVTVNVPAGTYLYKFVNGNAWSGAELVSTSCGVADGGGNVNRQVMLGSAALRLPAVRFGECGTVVRFAVNMRGRTVPRTGVHVIGNFQTLAGYAANWDPTAILLTDMNGDQIYEADVTLTAPGQFLYRFVNGNTLAAAEAVPAACGTADGTGTLARTLDATAPVNTVPTVCFGTCQSCGSSPTSYTTNWWHDAVFYEVFVRSFYDSNGDGRGDFAGLTAKLDYLNDGNPATTTDLGVTALWLMPMMESPSYHGYDVTNYKATEPDYGTMAEFEAFLSAAHSRGIKVIVDLVLNHSSSQHPWFTQAAASPTSPFRDWYVWSPTNPGYQGPQGQTVWHTRNGSFYYGVFGNGLPDLNWRNPQLKAAMWDVSRFWLQKGVDGYRIDAAKHLVENGRTQEHTPETLGILEEFHDSVKAVNPDAFIVGEVWSNTSAVVPYVVNNRLDATFEFDLALAIINSLNNGTPTALRNTLNAVESAYPKLRYATFLTNHDQNRVMNSLGGNEALMKQAAALYLTLPGVPFLYYGEEVGMLGAGPDEDKRRPMQWSAGTNAGFTTGTPWRGVNSNFRLFNVATQEADPASLLNHYKKLIRLRTTNETLRKGYLLPVTASSASLLSYARVYNQEAVVMVSNFSASPVSGTTLSLPLSTLPGGTYRVTDLYSGQTAGTVTLTAQGGVSSWAVALPDLDANQSWVLRLTHTQPTSTANGRNLLAAQLYPNPATRQVRVELDQAAAANAEISIHDLQGRLVRTVPMTGRAHTLDLSSWAAGTYLIKIRSGAAVSVQRLVVTH
ncbi:T9SS type A sorting domain-containing protein [Hymenobacter sp. BT175]|uniref:alpha-amylase family glycosyl hydrolase n=1 Tax=Hymenobacter translucens TaxID=2886507 RepID=UPI001D0E1A3F|nr:alpha-amylase family glycosyl hydrolase [Hymenobacter translucens]MCC2548219.1 T9SS type A sorting domain-containing protein [Hymenobacter translucens]